MAQSRASVSARAHFRSSPFGVPTRYRRPVAWSQVSVSALTVPRSMTQIRCAIPNRASMAVMISSTVVTSVRLPGKSS